jgi:hypothetical protein
MIIRYRIALLEKHSKIWHSREFEIEGVDEDECDQIMQQTSQPCRFSPFVQHTAIIGRTILEPEDLMAKLTDEEKRAWNAYRNHETNPSVEDFHNRYAGTWKNRQAYCEHYLVHTDGLRAKHLMFIDMNLYINTAETEVTFIDDHEHNVVHVFDNN